MGGGGNGGAGRGSSGSGERPVSNAAQSGKPVAERPRRDYYDLVTADAEPGEELVYGDAATAVIVRWREARDTVGQCQDDLDRLNASERAGVGGRSYRAARTHPAPSEPSLGPGRPAPGGAAAHRVPGRCEGGTEQAQAAPLPGLRFVAELGAPAWWLAWQPNVSVLGVD